MFLHRTAAVGAAALVAFGGLAAVTATPAFAATSQVSVVHGIPGQNVDVYVNGKKTLPDFKPGTVAGPLKLEEGSYDIVLTKPGDDISKAVLKVDDAEIPGGANISLVAHLGADGDPVLTPFANDVKKLDAGQTRLIVRHTAAAPAVDVRAAGEPVFENLTNPKEAKADLPAGTVKADVVLAGTDDVAIGPADLDLKEGTATIVYAVGSAEDKTLDLVTQSITGLHSAPGGVPSGSGGLADRGLGNTWYAVALAGLLLLGFGARRMVSTRR
ncbi:DUF4397 domain-containing protein [Actinoplanes friuliensis]|jgi:hypothetical protein|uniref:DUF4397 domain-containing protein n=1 Tax=Actinoplanes friuliensis DSM 7358 TaxID=1246995 RepID=U5VZM5_9ACTN|nr:DUF4397 domain-containing protein [Actinoplanes friuliensis]AGZ42448.1 hypothetical protein AFR_20880 [Actinoplanes friuliensis DSM 7358]